MEELQLVNLFNPSGIHGSRYVIITHTFTNFVAPLQFCSAVEYKIDNGFYMAVPPYPFPDRFSECLVVGDGGTKASRSTPDYFPSFASAARCKQIWI